MADVKWDRAFALEQSGDDEELLDELVGLFNDASASDLASMKDGFSNNDLQAMADAAHSIKGAAASMGIEGVRAVAASLEKAGRSGDVENVDVLMANLGDLLDQFESAS